MFPRDRIDKLRINFNEKQCLQYLISEYELDREENWELKLKKVLWNEIELEEIENIHALFYYALGAYYDGIIDVADFKSLWARLIEMNLLNFNDLAYFMYTVTPDKYLSNFTKFTDYILNNYNRFSPELPDFQGLINIYRDQEGEVSDLWDQVENKLISINSRPEYLEEILDNATSEQLEYLIFWVPWEMKEKVNQKLLDNKFKELNFEGYQELALGFGADSYLSDFPPSVNTLGSNLSKLEATTLDMDSMENVPEGLIKDWVPKFVYSIPDLSYPIKIYFPGGRHIGHSAILLRSKYGIILLDFGLSVVNNSLPYWFPIMEKLDAILVSHAHLDHSGGLPLLLGNKKKTPWFGLNETAVMTKMLWNDTNNIMQKNFKPEMLDSSSILSNIANKGNIINVLSNFNKIEIGESFQLLPDVQVKAHNAAHLFGSAGFELTIDGKRILYTGDFNADGSFSFEGAEFPMDCDLTIFDGTYYGRYQDYQPPETTLQHVIEESSRILIPAFSMGRSQEILFQLKKLNADKDWKIYLTGMGGRLARELNMTVGKSGGGRDTGVSIVPTVEEEEFTENTIVIGGQGMIQVGTSRRLFNFTKDDEETSVVLCGYQAPYTMGYHFLNGNDYLRQNYKQRVYRVKMSGHTSGKTLDKFMNNLTGKKYMVHSPVGAYENYPRDDINRPQNRKPVEIE